MEFFIADLREFFDKNKFQSANWEAVKNEMLKDNDIISTKYGDGDYGEIFKKILERSG